MEDTSTNGTYVNGEKVPRGKPVKLEVHDTLSLADPRGEYYLEYILELANDGRSPARYGSSGMPACPPHPNFSMQVWLTHSTAYLDVLPSVDRCPTAGSTTVTC